MRTLRSIAACLAILTKIIVCKATAHDDIRILEAIAQVESGGDDAAVGKPTARGECAVGRYQILPSTWRDRTDWPVAYAHDHLKAQVVAVAHLNWLRARLAERLGADNVTTYHLICAWRYGHAYTGKWDTKERYMERHQYCTRVNNFLDTHLTD